MPKPTPGNPTGSELEITHGEAPPSTESIWTEAGGKLTPPIDDASHTEMEMIDDQQHYPQSISREMTTFVEQGWGEDYVEDDPLKKNLPNTSKRRP